MRNLWNLQMINFFFFGKSRKLHNVKCRIVRSILSYNIKCVVKNKDNKINLKKNSSQSDLEDHNVCQ